MVVLVCSLCSTDLTIHCANVNCAWMKCRNSECTADIYDLDGGSLLMTNGDVQLWRDT